MYTMPQLHTLCKSQLSKSDFLPAWDSHLVCLVTKIRTKGGETTQAPTRSFLPHNLHKLFTEMIKGGFGLYSCLGKPTFTTLSAISLFSCIFIFPDSNLFSVVTKPFDNIIAVSQNLPIS